MDQAKHAATGFSRRLTLRARDGYTLAAHLFEPRGHARANLVIHGALAVPSHFYAHFAEALADAGLRVLTYDYRGVAGSRPPKLRGFDADLEDWAERDAPAAVEFLAQHHGNVKTFALGHSLGGQILAVDRRAREATHGAFLVASQNGYHGAFRGARKLGVLAFWYGILPLSTRVFDYMPGFMGLGTDVPRGVAEQWGRWCKDPRYFFSTHPHYQDALARFDRPLRALSFTDDWYAPRANVEWLLAQYRNAARVHEHLSPAQVGAEAVGHFGFFARRQGSALWPRVLAFVDDCLGASMRPGAAA